MADFALDAEPDPMAAFAPAEGMDPADIRPDLVREAPALASGPEMPADLFPEAPLLSPSAEPAAEPAPEPAPAPPRPAVTYIGQGGDRVYRLLYPLKIEGREVRNIIVRHPTLWLVQDWIAGRVRSNFAIMAAMCDMTEIELGALRWPDAQAIIGLTSAMLPDFIRDALAAQGTGSVADSVAAT